MAGVSLRNVVKRFGAVPVIHGASLEVADGEFVVFVGPSGCGKSTLLRMIAGLEDTTDGEISIGGKVVNDVEPADRGIAMVFQSYALYPHLTVEQNLSFGLRHTGNPKEDTRRRVQRAAEILRIPDLMARRPRQLSGGQRQRVAIGRAIVRDPQVFLFDEPLSNLDAELRVEMRLQIAQLRRRLGATFIYVTHDQVEAMTLADTIVVLRAGVIEQVGAPLELYHRPANRFVAGFIGSPKMNFIPAAAVSGLDLRGAASVGVRPEHLQLGDGPLQGVVRTVENLGAVSYAYAALPDETLVTVELPPDHTVAVDQPVRLSIAPGKAYLFDAEGRTIG